MDLNLTSTAEQDLTLSQDLMSSIFSKTSSAAKWGAFIVASKMASSTTMMTISFRWEWGWQIKRNKRRGLNRSFGYYNFLETSRLMTLLRTCSEAWEDSAVSAT
jgi:hypothetical protein